VQCSAHFGGLATNEAGDSNIANAGFFDPGLDGGLRELRARQSHFSRDALMEESHINSGSRITAHQLLDVIKAEVAGRHFANVLNHVAAPHSRLFGRRAFQHRDDVGITAHSRNNQAGFGSDSLRIELLDLFRREVRAVRIEYVRQPSEASDANLFQIGLIHIVPDDVHEHLIEDLNLPVLAASRDTLTGFGNYSSDDRVKGYESGKDDDGYLRSKPHPKLLGWR